MPLVLLELLEPLEPLGLPGPLEALVQQEVLVHLVRLVQAEPLVRPGLQDLPVQLVE